MFTQMISYIESTFTITEVNSPPFVLREAGGMLGESDRGDYAESAARDVSSSFERLLRRSRILVGKSSPNPSDPARKRGQ